MAVAERLSAQPQTDANGTDGIIETEPQPMRWTTEEFHRIGDLGVFEGKHAELIEGEILVMNAMGDPHVTSVHLASQALRQAFVFGFYIRSESPLNISERTDPEPDIAVVRGRIRDFANRTPTPEETLMVVEVSDTTLRRDRRQKASLYARAGIPEYWIINLIDKQLEVHRAPQSQPNQPFGFGYSEVKIYQSDETVAPLAAPETMVKVEDLLP